MPRYAKQGLQLENVRPWDIRESDGLGAQLPAAKGLLYTSHIRTVALSKCQGALCTSLPHSKPQHSASKSCRIRAALSISERSSPA